MSKTPGRRSHHDQRQTLPGISLNSKEEAALSPSCQAVEGRRQGAAEPGAGPCPVDSPPGSPVGQDKAVPGLQRFQFQLLGMNHPPFPPPGLLSGLLRPRPQWPASGRSSTAPAPRAVRLRLKPLPAAGPARPASWGLDPGRSRSNRTACGVAPHGRGGYVRGESPPRRPGPQERRVRTSRSGGASSKHQSGF